MMNTSQGTAVKGDSFELSLQLPTLLWNLPDTFIVLLI